MLFLGCDGGATKYDYILCDEHGHIHARRRFKGINIVADGMLAFRNGIRAHINEMIHTDGLSAQSLDYCAFGLSGYGESKTSVRDMTDTVTSALAHDRFFIGNDSVISWSGALKLRPGISIASGTGSVAFGMDGLGNSGRAGGWSVRLGDEGSAYWITKEAINIFFRQADGRLHKTLLYNHFMRKFELSDPLHFPMAMEECLGSSISGIAAFQREVLILYQLGDPAVKHLYERAAGELASLAAALMDRLSFSPGQPVDVSYSGGLFKAGDCILLPFQKEIGALGARLVQPAYGPLVGAVCYAAKGKLKRDALDAMFEEVNNALLRRTED